MASGTLANRTSKRAVSVSRGTSLLLRVSPTAEIVAPPVRKKTVVNKSHACDLPSPRISDNAPTVSSPSRFAIQDDDLAFRQCRLIDLAHGQQMAQSSANGCLRQLIDRPPDSL